MKQLFFLILLFTFSFFGHGQQPIKFYEGSQEEIFDEAAKTGKSILIFYGQPKEFSFRLFLDQLVAEQEFAKQLYQKYLLVSITVDHVEMSQKLSKLTLLKPYTVSLISTDGHLLYQMRGPFSIESFKKSIETIGNDGQNFHRWSGNAEVNQDELPIDDLFRYAKALYKAGLDYHFLESKIFNLADDSFLQSAKGIESILLFSHDLTDDRIRYLLDSWQQIEKADADWEFINRRLEALTTDAFIQLKIANPKSNFEDSLVRFYERIEYADLIYGVTRYKMRYFGLVEKNNEVYFQSMVELLSGGSNLVTIPQRYEWLNEIADACENQEILQSAIQSAHEMVNEDNRVEYQAILTKLFVKAGYFPDADHAMNILEELNQKQRVYSAAEVEIMRKQLEESVLKYKKQAKNKSGK